MNGEEASARLEINDVLLRYTRGLDRLDMDLVRGCFHADATVQFPESLHIGPLDGFMEFVSAQMPLFARRVHFLGNPLIEFDGAETAHVETYQLAGVELPEVSDDGADRIHWRGDFITLWSRYVDRFERRNDAWLIARRRLLVDYMSKDAVRGSFDRPGSGAAAQPEGDDPVLRPVAGFGGTPLTKDVWP